MDHATTQPTAGDLSPSVSKRPLAALGQLMEQPFVRGIAALPLLLATFPAAVAVRYDAWPPYISPQALGIIAVCAALLKFATFLAFGVFRIRTRHLSLEDLVVLLKATAFAGVAIAVLVLTAPFEIRLSRSVWLIDCGLTGVLFCTLQVVRRLVGDHVRSKAITRNRRVSLIVGSELFGEAMLHAVRREPRSPFVVKGFVTVDDGSGRSLRQGTTIGGLPVVGRLTDACQVARQLGANELLVTAGDLSGKQLRTLVDQAESCGQHVTVLPSYRQLLQGEVSLQPREVEIEDLLQREPIQLDASRLQSWLRGRTVMVTGSSGSIGSEVCRQLLQFAPAKLLLVDQSETGQFFLDRELGGLADDATTLVPLIADVRDGERMDRIFSAERPEIIFHAAAYKHVPLMESNGAEAIKVNVLGTKLLADLADKYEAESFVMVSTDKAVRPTSRMGATKRVAELYVQSLAVRSSCRFVTVRFGNVLGSAGSVVPIFRQQIARGGPITVTHADMTRFFMTIPEAAQLIVQAGGQGKGSEIFVLDMGEPVKVLDLARDMIRLSGLRENEDIDIVFSGTRPGEKLYEELYTDGESQQPTEHEKILVAESEEINFFQVSRAIAELERNRNADGAILDATIASLIPSYRLLTAKTGTGSTPLRVVTPDGDSAAAVASPLPSDSAHRKAA